MLKPTERFSDRVTDYVKYRPSYPQQMIDKLIDYCGLTQDAVIADIGSGTGKLTELLLHRELNVIGVEPNAEMREAAKQQFSSADNFQSVAGNAERTLLNDRSIDLIVAGQAFHWFEPEQAKTEFDRVLKPGGKVALIWNRRKTELAFHREYDEMLRAHCTEYELTNHRSITLSEIQAFCSPREVVVFNFDYRQQFDLNGFLGRMYSSSYTPDINSKARKPLDTAATVLFEKYARDGVLDFLYQTEVYIA